VKALSACRLDDLCNIRSSQLQDGRIVFGADVAKDRSEPAEPWEGKEKGRRNLLSRRPFR